MRILHLVAYAGIGCIVIGLSYLLILRVGLSAWNSPLNPLYRPGVGLDPNSGVFLAVLLITLPYLMGGIFLGSLRAARLALASGLVTTIAERLLIIAAASLVLGQFRQVIESGEVIYAEGGPDLIRTIQSEALPYFSGFYILLGAPVSIIILHLTARLFERMRGASRLQE